MLSFGSGMSPFRVSSGNSPTFGKNASSAASSPKAIMKIIGQNVSDLD